MKRKSLQLTGRHSVFDRIAGRVTRVAGSSLAFAFACGAIVAWAATGPLFGYSEAWQLVVNTGTTILTFLMVFLIQHAQNKDSLAIHIKLNELLAATERASNRVVAIEDLDETDLGVLRDFYCELARQAERAGGVKESHSLDEARLVAERKVHARSARGRQRGSST